MLLQIDGLFISSTDVSYLVCPSDVNGAKPFSSTLAVLPINTRHNNKQYFPFSILTSGLQKQELINASLAKYTPYYIMYIMYIRWYATRIKL